MLAASAAYHLIPYATFSGVRTANALDLALIPLSIFASIAPFAAGSSTHFLREVALGLLVLAFNVLVVAVQVACSLVRCSPPPAVSSLRSCWWVCMGVSLTAISSIRPGPVPILSSAAGPPRKQGAPGTGPPDIECLVLSLRSMSP